MTTDDSWEPDFSTTYTSTRDNGAPTGAGYSYNAARSNLSRPFARGRGRGFRSAALNSALKQEIRVPSNPANGFYESTFTANTHKGHSEKPFVDYWDVHESPDVSTTINNSVEFPVPGKDTAVIIGRRGDRIRQLENNSGARIQVSRGDPSIVCISGTPEQRSTAKKLIHDLLNASQRSPQKMTTTDSQVDSNSFVQEQDTIEMTVQPKDAGAIIGRGGQRIRELESDSGARIKVDRGTYDTTVKISGQPSQCAQAKKLIEELLQSQSQSGFGSAPSSGNRRGFDNNSSDVTEFEIGANEAGKVIGRGGEKIRELQDSCNVRIKVDSNDENGYLPSAKVRIFGSEEDRAACRRLIEELLYPDSSRRVQEDMVAEKPRTLNWGELREKNEEYQRQKWMHTDPIVKDFYIEDRAVAAMLPDDVEQFKEQNNNIVTMYLGEGVCDVPNPIGTFDQAFRHYPEILDELYKEGFEKPTPIQCQAWPILMKGYDMIGIAQTGTGKTIAFLLPAFLHIEGQTRPRSERDGPTVLVLSPTRELALQIESEVRKYRYHGIKCVCVYGGGSRKNQINVCTEGVEIVVATPGRLNDLVQADIIKLSSVSYLVLDEADRMLDMGFEPQIRKVMIDIRPDRQTVMTSATWPEGVRRLATRYMNGPIQVFIGTLDLKACEAVEQTIEIIDEEQKYQRLKDFLEFEMDEHDKALVFVGRKITADHISSDFALRGICLESIHGDREQIDREQALQSFRDGSVRVLIATDVASRGLDVRDITVVFNYDFPMHMEEYVHRVGRTGRAGKTGRAITLMTRQDWKNASGLITILAKNNQPVPNEVHRMAERYEAMKLRREQEGPRGGRSFGGGGGGGFRGRDAGDGGSGFGSRAFGGGKRRDRITHEDIDASAGLYPM